MGGKPWKASMKGLNSSRNPRDRGIQSTRKKKRKFMEQLEVIEAMEEMERKKKNNISRQKPEAKRAKKGRQRGSKNCGQNDRGENRDRDRDANFGNTVKNIANSINNASIDMGNCDQ
jgi:hypothetical protein